ncbi:MAG: cation-efflux pump [Patescibacteria group bacterium]|jgi:cation diffusion facilitator family transporter
MSHNHINHKKENVALSSVIASFLMTAMKLVVGILTGSMGIISEAAHSALDLVAAVMTYFAVKIGDKPADSDHPYGHGKIESVSALIETGLLFLTSFWIIYEAIKRLIEHDTEVHATWYAFVIIIISIIIDISRSRALYKVAKSTNSQALEADALHFNSDIYSSAVVLLGLVFVAFGIKGADSIAAIGVAVFVLIAGYRLGKRTIDVLVDTAPKGVKETVDEIILKSNEKIIADYIRVRSLGPNIFIDMGIKISRRLSLEKVDEIVNGLKTEINKKVPGSEIAIHTSSIKTEDETIVETIQILSAKNSMFIHDIVVENLDNNKFVSFDLELPNDLTVEEAHEKASLLEKLIQDALDSKIELNIHIDPIVTKELKSEKISDAELSTINQKVQELAKNFDKLADVHNISARKINGKLYITMHCYADNNLSLEESHAQATKLKNIIRENITNVERVIVHVEPKNK